MAVEETIAVVGLQSGKLTGFTEKLAMDDFRLLLIPGSKDEMNRLNEEVEELKLQSEVEILNCAKNGCWEADIIAFINPHDPADELVTRIKEVAVQKVVMVVFEGISSFIANERYDAFKKAMPHSKLVRLVVLPEEKVSMWGEDKLAVQKVAKLLVKSPYTITQ